MNSVRSDGLGQRCKTKDCEYEFPIQYIQEYELYERLFIQVFGWTSHGKTVFLNAMRLMLLDMGKLWPQYTQQGITELDMAHERALRAELKNGKMPAPTQLRDRRPDEVYITKLDMMPRWRSTWLIMMDHAGELFSNFKIGEVKVMPFLLKTPITFFLISIPKTKDDTVGRAGEAMDQLFNTYLQTLLDNKINFRKMKRQLVIVFTMADKILSDLPPELRQYLASDNAWVKMRSPTSVVPMDDEAMIQYIARMHEIDKAIREWLLNDVDGAPGGANMVRRIEKEGIDAHYSLVSATGYDVEQFQNESIPIVPRRILDPFFWAMEFAIPQK
jgi:hypothetical protein